MLPTAPGPGAGHPTPRRAGRPGGGSRGPIGGGPRVVDWPQYRPTPRAGQDATRVPAVSAPTRRLSGPRRGAVFWWRC